MTGNCELKNILMAYDSKIGRRSKPFVVNMSDFELDILRGCAKEEKCSMSELMRSALKNWYLEKGLGLN